MSKIKVIDRRDIESDAKIYCISDIHGALPLLKRTISDIDLTKDYLFILGDLSSKGSFIRETLDYIMDLDSNPHVSVIMGNCDRADIHSIQEDHLEWFQKIIHGNWLVSTFAKEYYNNDVPNLSIGECLNLQKEFAVRYQKYFDYLKNLHHVIITNDYIFTHSGVSYDLNFDNDDLEKYVRNYTFYEDGHYSDKIIVCGHMPTAIYQKTKMNYDIFYDPLKRIILLDGGMNVAIGGQLNRLTIANNQFFFDRYEDYEEKVVLSDQVACTYMKGPFWPDFKIEILQEHQYFYLCKNVKTLEISLIKKELVTSVNDHFEVSGDCVGSLIDTRCGDKVKFIKYFDGYSLVKKDGTLGWIDNNKIGVKNENK